jgi:hypothetical protein
MIQMYVLFGYFHLAKVKMQVHFFSSVGIATGWTAEVQFQARARNFSLLGSVQIGSGAHSASSEGKATGI